MINIDISRGRGAFPGEATNGYALPSDACVSCRTLYQALATFEADLHQHIHLENNILFPGALKMENEAF